MTGPLPQPSRAARIGESRSCPDRNGRAFAAVSPLALLIPQDGTVPRIPAALGVQPTSLRAAILDRYRKAS
jgi:hypothetical protein